jgi:hypothetical protein
MIRLGFLLLFVIGVFAAPVLANTGRMALNGPEGICFAVVVVVNSYGVYNADETLETDHGAVVVNYDTIGGHNKVDADLVKVMSLPDGVTADPMELALPDGETGRICLLEWLGG